MKKVIAFIILSASLGGNLQAQDTLWQRPAPLGNYYNNHWIDTTDLYAICYPSVPRPRIIARQFYTQDTLQVYGIAAMMANMDSLHFVPSSVYPTLHSYLAAKYPEDPTFDNCEEWLMLFQYGDSSSPVMQQVGDSLPVHMLHTPVSYYIMSTTPPTCYEDPIPKPVYERYYSEPQTVYDTFYAGFTQNDGGYAKDSVWKYLRPPFWCMGCCYRDMRDLDETWACFVQPGIYLNSQPCFWEFRRDMFVAYYIFPILTPEPDTTGPGDPIVPNPGDTLTTGYLILHSGNTLVVAPGDTLVIGGDTLVVTGDTLVVTLGDTLVLGGSTFVVNPGDTLFVNPGDTLFVSPDGTVTVNPGGTFVVGSGSGTPGDDPGVGLRQADMLYRYTSVSPNPATQRATVTSSFGLERIEVYDPQGRQMLTLPATGYRATLDLSAWPRGTYLLRIHTPLGPTTKKLIVQ